MYDTSIVGSKVEETNDAIELLEKNIDKTRQIQSPVTVRNRPQ